MIIHVEMGPRITCCGKSPQDLADGADEVIADREWHVQPEAIQRATCPDCLLRLFMLGDSASIALRRMGMKVDVRDVDDESLAEN